MREIGTRCIALIIFASLVFPAALTRAAEATTGTLSGTVFDDRGAPIAQAHIVASAPSAIYKAVSDARGTFTVFGVIPDTYVVSADSPRHEPASRAGVVVLPGQNERVAFVLERQLQTIATVHSTARAFTAGSTTDTFTVSGQTAKALSPSESSSGLANYTAGTVQGAIAAVPGVDQDSFANAILRAGKIDDAVFDYDSVPVPQGLVAEPGGNIVGAQLPTTGIASTTVTLSGYQAENVNALGGVIDQIPAVGAYPGRTTMEFTTGAGILNQRFAMQSLWATPDRKWRYAFATTLGSQYFSYGDGKSFYPAEAGTYGLALQTRGETSFAGNVHDQLSPHDDLSFDALVGSADYTQYGTPYPGETYGAFNGATTVFPGQTNPNAPVNFATGIRGTYDIFKTQWVHDRAHSLQRVQLYQSQFGSNAGGPFWDDLSFPDGPISLSAQQGGREQGLSYDIDDLASEHHHVKYGAIYRVNNSFLDQVVPTADEFITSSPTLSYYLAYLSDTWSMSPRFDLTGTARLGSTHIRPSFGAPYDVTALDPHVSASYKIGNDLAVRATYDHTTVPPKPLEADRTDTANVTPNGSPAPFSPLAPETANDFTYSIEGGGRTHFRISYYAEFEQNRIDVLPVNFRSVASGGANPSAIGIPTNAGELRAHGVELWANSGGFTFDADYVRAFSSSASQFAYNDLNAAAIAAGHLFPVNYLPELSVILSYEFRPTTRLRITPSVSYESGYPYGNGTMIWTFNPVTKKPEQIPNDNFVNPGFNYYFLKDPSNPYNAVTNPYIANLDTGEGADPNTLRTAPQTLVSLHAEDDITPRVTAILDVVNLFAVASPTQLQGNPYLIGPPGYAGGNPLYATAYQAAAGFAQPYILGNGVPTSDGRTQALPWTYGRGGYVPEAYPLARTVQLSLRIHL